MADFPERIKALEPFWGSWRLDAVLGEGSYGKVYRIKHEEFGTVYYSALKWISLPQNQSELKALYNERMTDASIREYYASVVRNLQTEITLMNKLRGTSHVVSFEDHAFIERTDEIGWDMLIRMELLTPLPDRVRRGMTVRDVIHMGLDMCDALTLCGRNHIIHRDIKPDNIFYSDNGDYKLGDFGVARQMERTMTNMSVKGTPFYMAPEVYTGKPSDATVDQYSLGLVMHRLLNAQLVPFAPITDHILTHPEREEAFLTRIKGTPVPPPFQGGVRLKQAICRACNANPKKRFSGPEAFRAELQAALNERENDDPLAFNTAASLRSGRSDVGDQNTQTQAAQRTTLLTRRLSTGLLVLLFLLVATGVWLYNAEGRREKANLTGSPTSLAEKQVASPGGASAGSTKPKPPATTYQSYIASIEWDDQNNLEGFRPAYRMIDLLAEGKTKAQDTQILNDDNAWQYQWTNLPTGNYTIRSNNIAHYTLTSKTMGDQTILTASHTPTLIQYTVELSWNDVTGAAETKPANILITLSNDVTQTLLQATVPRSENSYTWYDLPQYLNGQFATYSAKIDPLVGYSIELAQHNDAKSVFQFNPKATPTPITTPTPTSTPTPTPTPPPTPTPLPVSRYVNQPVIMLPMQNLLASVSRGPNSRGVRFDAMQLIDGQEDTCWQYSTTDGNTQAYVDISFQQACQVSSLWIKNGYWKISSGLDQYARNSRPKTIKLSFTYQDGREQTDALLFKLADDYDRATWQQLDFDPHDDVVQVRIQVMDLYYGTKFPEDVAVSELCFMGCLPAY